MQGGAVLNKNDILSVQMEKMGASRNDVMTGSSRSAYGRVIALVLGVDLRVRRKAVTRIMALTRTPGTGCFSM
jgi:hypothetical protein